MGNFSLQFFFFHIDEYDRATKVNGKTPTNIAVLKNVYSTCPPVPMWHNDQYRLTAIQKGWVAYSPSLEGHSRGRRPLGIIIRCWVRLGYGRSGYGNYLFYGDVPFHGENIDYIFKISCDQFRRRTERQKRLREPKNVYPSIIREYAAGLQGNTILSLYRFYVVEPQLPRWQDKQT